MTDFAQRPIRVLLVEEDPAALEALQDALFAGGKGRYQTEWTGELGQALQRLSMGGVDVVLLDLKLPDSEGLATFERANAFAPHRPLSALWSLSLIDELTGLYNRRGFMELGEQHLKLARRTERGLALRERIQGHG